MFLKVKRLVNKKAVEAERKDRCEACPSTWGLQVHHVISRGSGGPDMAENLICLCASCHTKAHAGNILRGELFKIVGRRLGISADECYKKIRRVMRGEAA